MDELNQALIATRKRTEELLRLDKQELAAAEAYAAGLREKLSAAQKELDRAEISVNERADDVRSLQKEYDEMWRGQV